MIQKKSYLTSLLFIFFSCLCTTALFYGFQAIKKKQANNQKYQIQKLFLKGKGGDLLTGALVSEMLDLHIGSSLSLLEFDIGKKEEELRKIAIFRSLKLEKRAPDCLVVIYELYEPCAIFEDQSNTLVNEEGMVMPYQPYFSLKKLPKVLIGDNLSWGEKIPSEKWHFIQKALLLDANLFMIDVRFCFERKKQRNELVLEVARDTNHDWLRLNPLDFEEGWKKYLSLKSMLPQKAQIVELRYRDMALYEQRAN